MKRSVLGLLWWLAVVAVAVAGFWWAGRSREPRPPPGRKVISWIVVISPLRDFYEAEVAEFEQLHPDIQVRIIWVPASEYHMKFKTLAAAGEAPDLFYCGDVWLRYLLPFMRDLTPFVERDAVEIGLDDYFPPIRAAMQQDGKYYVLPEAVNVALLYYNRRLFAAAGIAEPTENWTWADLVHAGEALTQPARDGQPGAWGCGRVEGWWGKWLIYVRQAGGRIFTPDGRRCTLDSPEAIAGLKFFADKSARYHFSAPAGFEPLNGFVNQRVAMVVGGHVSFWLNYNQMPDLDWDVQLLPAGPATRRGGELAIAGYSMSQHCVHPEAAWSLLKFLTRREAIAQVVARGGIAVRQSAAKAHLRQRSPGEHPRNLAAVYRQMDFAEPIPRHPHFIELMLQIVQPEIDRLIQGELTPEQAAHRAAAAANAYLATFESAAP